MLNFITIRYISHQGATRFGNQHCLAIRRRQFKSDFLLARIFYRLFSYKWVLLGVSSISVDISAIKRLSWKPVWRIIRMHSSSSYSDCTSTADNNYWLGLRKRNVGKGGLSRKTNSKSMKMQLPAGSMLNQLSAIAANICNK